MTTMVLYGKLPINMLGGETAGETKAIDFLSNAFKWALFTDNYVPAQDTDELYSDISTNEVASGDGYTTGGNAATSPTVGYTGGTNIAKFDTNDPTPWTAAGAGWAFRYAVGYDSTTGILYGYLDYGSTLTMNAGDVFGITLDSAGAFSASVA